ncbi:hypothetical protein SAMN05421837_101446 [Amycolatopsis pretoriensis]|uniref:Uncharacterized protein n=1 Tax=Amycolatopsis pretoriensis TaxID=218821 RepID=A0A1H5Q3F1_9PSEU|nr:hypothetical protein SAMN05421837_101446 [Amycolatopsis pretoriensis]
MTVTGRTALETEPNEHNRSYLSTKRHRMGHRLERIA